jgi:hypothetical protein
VLILVLPRIDCAELPKSATLDEVLALATRPEQPDQRSGYDEERFNALRRLENWPAATPQDEERMAAALTASLYATNGNIRNGGAWGLGERGRSEAIPTIFALGENDANLIGCFFQGYTYNREVEE